jgi:hypothetical protein
MENKEIASLAEALVLSFAYAENGLAELLAEFEIIDVEKTRVVPGFGGLQWISIEDGLLRSRSDGEHYILSFKTTSERWGKRMSERGLYDNQGISESWAVKQQTGIRPLGIKMIYLHKGYKKFDQVTGDWNFENFLTRGWTVPGITGEDQVWKWNQYFSCPGVPHTMPSGRKCKGDGSTKNHKIPDVFERVLVADHRPLSGWIEELAGLNDEMGQQVLGRVVINPEVYFRSDEDMQEWFEEVSAQEAHIDIATGKFYRFDDANQHNIMVGEFPKNRNACTNDYGRLCGFIPLCFKGAASDPIGSGLYQLRTASSDNPEIDQLKCTSRSRAEVYQQCPRKRFWAYEWMKGQSVTCPACSGFANDHEPCPNCGRGGYVAHIGGLQSPSVSVDAVIGSAVHLGLAHLLRNTTDPETSSSGLSDSLFAIVVGEAGKVAYDDCLENLPEQIKMATENELAAGVEDMAGLGIY